MENIFTVEGIEKIEHRVNKLEPTNKALWGKMDVARMLAHCNVTYEMVYDNKHPKPNFLMGFILKKFIKKIVTSDTPYKKNSSTAPAFKIVDEKLFEEEKSRLLNYIKKTQELGESHFEGKESLSFGKLNKTEWNNMFSKHLDHHLQQFGV